MEIGNILNFVKFDNKSISSNIKSNKTWLC